MTNVCKSDIKKIFYNLVKNVSQKWQVPNLTYALIHHGEILDINTFGLDESSARENINKIYRIGSNSKAVACAALIELVNKGQILLEDNVTNYLPNFKMYTKELTEQTKIIDLVTHSTGVGKYTCSLLCYLGYPRESLVNSYQFLKPVKPFRSSFQYNNGMYVVAGELIKKVTGMSNDIFLKNEIFSKLGMNDTTCSLNNIYTSRIAVPHVEHKNKTTAISQSPFGDALSIGGNINTTIYDLVKWLLFNIDSTDTKNEKFNNYLPLFETRIKISQPKSPGILGDRIKTNAYTMGWYKANFDNNTIFEHMGGFSGYMSNISFSPELKSGIILLSNKSNIWYQLEMLRLNFYELIIDDKFSDLTESILHNNNNFSLLLNKKIDSYKSIPNTKSFNGFHEKYFNNVYGEIIFNVNNDDMYISIGPNLTRIRLEYLGNNQFKLVDDYSNFGTMFKIVTLTFLDNKEKLKMEIYIDDLHGSLSWVDTQHFDLVN